MSPPPSWPSSTPTNPSKTERAGKAVRLDKAQFDAFRAKGYLSLPALLSRDEVAVLEAAF